MKYNVRKKEAQAKLESSRTNLQRVNDIITEVKKQINLIDRLAKKAEKYKKLSSELRFIELKIAKKDYHALKNSFEEILSEYTKLREEDSLKRAELAKTENETETKRLELLEREKMLEQVQIKFQNLEKEIAEVEKIIAIAITERDNYKEYLTKLYQQEEEFNQKKADGLIKQKELDKIEADLLSEIERQKELLREKSDFVRYMEEELIGNEDLSQEKRREIFRISEELRNLRNDQNRLHSSFESLNHREASSIKEVENLKSTLAGIDSSLKDLESNLLEKNNSVLLLNEKKELIINE